MRIQRYSAIAVIIVLAMVLAAVGTLLGCHAAGKPASTSQPQPAAAAPPPAQTPQGWAGTMGHAELWTQTCNRCHYAWSPDQLSPAQWEVVMHHMRLRANLTGDEQKAILEFLQSASR
jgi:hypothetical protein